MRLNFILESETSWSAISLDSVFEEFLHEELYWADIDKTSIGSFMVRWQSDYSSPIHFQDFPSACNYVCRNYNNYKPISNGKRYRLDNEE